MPLRIKKTVRKGSIAQLKNWENFDAHKQCELNKGTHSKFNLENQFFNNGVSPDFAQYIGEVFLQSCGLKYTNRVF